MANRKFTMTMGLIALALTAALAEPVWAQGGGRGGRGGFGRGMGMGRGLRVFHQIELATLPEVQDDLKLTADQKSAVADLEDEYSEERRALRGGGGGGGFGGPPTEEQLAAQAKLSADYAAKLNELLDDAQDARILGIFAQVNGTVALTDPALVTALELTEDQVQNLRDVGAEQGRAMFEAFRDFQDMTDDERAAKLEELQTARDAALLAVLTDQQRATLDALKGAALQVDTSPLQRFGRGGRGGFGGGGGPGGGGRRGRPAADQ